MLIIIVDWMLLLTHAYMYVVKHAHPCFDLYIVQGMHASSIYDKHELISSYNNHNKMTNHTIYWQYSTSEYNSSTPTAPL